LYNAALIISDGLEARIGTLTADRERFMPWRTIEGEELAPSFMPQIEVMLLGVFDRRRFLDLIRHFIVFEDEGGGQLVKKMAGYHQFHAVNAALEETLRAADKLGKSKEEPASIMPELTRRRRSKMWVIGALVWCGIHRDRARA